MHYILDKANNYKDLARYLFKAEKQGKNPPNTDNAKKPRRKFTKRWSGTRNLKKPIITTAEIKRESIMSKVPTAPKGFTLLPDWVLSCDCYGHLVRRYAYVRLPGENPPKLGAGGKRRKPPPRK